MINQELVDFVKDALSKNRSKLDITNDLKKGDWSDADIGEVFFEVQQSTPGVSFAPRAPSNIDMQKPFLRSSVYVWIGILGAAIPLSVTPTLWFYVTTQRTGLASNNNLALVLPAFFLILFILLIQVVISNWASKGMSAEPSWKKAFFLMGAIVILSTIALLAMLVPSVFGLLLVVGIVCWIMLAKKTYSIGTLRAVYLWIINFIAVLLIVGIVGFLGWKISPSTSILTSEQATSAAGIYDQDNATYLEYATPVKDAVNTIANINDLESNQAAAHPAFENLLTAAEALDPKIDELRNTIQQQIDQSNDEQTKQVGLGILKTLNDQQPIVKKDIELATFGVSVNWDKATDAQKAHLAEILNEMTAIKKQQADSSQ